MPCCCLPLFTDQPTWRSGVAKKFVRVRAKQNFWQRSTMSSFYFVGQGDAGRRKGGVLMSRGHVKEALKGPRLTKKRQTNGPTIDNEDQSCAFYLLGQCSSINTHIMHHSPFLDLCLCLLSLFFSMPACPCDLFALWKCLDPNNPLPLTHMPFIPFSLVSCFQFDLWFITICLRMTLPRVSSHPCLPVLSYF